MCGNLPWCIAFSFQVTPTVSFGGLPLFAAPTPPSIMADEFDTEQRELSQLWKKTRKDGCLALWQQARVFALKDALLTDVIKGH